MRPEIIEILSGSLGGIVSTAFGHPLDTIKMRRQVHPNLYKSTLSSGRSIIAKEGVRSLFKGVMPPVLAQGFTNAILFGSASYCNEHLNIQSKYEKTFYSGMVAGTAVSMIDCPVELVKTQLQGQGMGRMKDGTDRTMLTMAQLMVRHNGVRGLYQVWTNVYGLKSNLEFQGFVLTLWRNVPTYGVFFLVNAYLTDYFVELGLAGELLAGAVTGIVSWTMAYPADTLKTRFQADPMLNRQYTSSLSVLTSLLRNDSWRALFYGLSPCLVRSIPVCAILFTVQHRSSQYLTNKFTS